MLRSPWMTSGSRQAKPAARDAIASTKKKELLGETGDTFELTLLLTQSEALSYAWHLAKVTGENEPQPERARALAGLSRDMQNLYQEVFALLLSNAKPSATRENNPAYAGRAPGHNQRRHSQVEHPMLTLRDPACVTPSGSSNAMTISFTRAIVS